MKTLQQCTESGLPFSQFLKIGDEVDESIFDYFLCVLPPVTWTKDCLQMGEPYNHNEQGKPQYLTLEKVGDNWTYTGIKPRPVKVVEPVISAGPSRSTRRQIRLNKAARSYAKNFKSGKTGVRYN
jgi:hypothetical protein